MSGRAPSGLLRQIDPVRLGEDVVRQLTDHVVRMAMLVSPRHEIVVQTPSPESYAEIGTSVTTLALYARDATPLDAPVPEYLISLIPLYQAPLGDAPIDLDDEADASTELGTVIRAALARERLDAGHALTPGQLAVLGSVTPQQVRHLVRTGELRADDGTLPVEECRRWLGTRS